jgi:hypothetical protein
MVETTKSKWLLLIHQLPPKPDYFRVKISRRLQQVGAVAIKQSVYALPNNDQAFEDFNWLFKEIIRGGGEASISEAHFVEGLSDEKVEGMFQSARQMDYEGLLKEARSLIENIGQVAAESKGDLSKLKLQLRRLRRRFEEVTTVDFFQAPGRNAVEGILYNADSNLKGARPKRAHSLKSVEGKTWVTRKSIFVDRIACGWFIKRFVDRGARLKFVALKGYKRKADELVYDTFDADFTHDGDRCTFEVMIDGFGSADPALAAIAKIIHDMDLKDEKFGMIETDGINALFTGIVLAHKDDAERLTRGSIVLDELYEYFSRKVRRGGRPGGFPASGR